MVDARDELLSALQLVLHVKSFQETLGADLNAVAEAYGLYIGVALHIAGEHGHGIGVVQEQGIGADLLHIRSEVPQHGDGAQGPHDAADAEGIGDGLTQGRISWGSQSP